MRMKPITMILPIGISGSGKSRLYETVYRKLGYEKVCPDTIRKELTGNVSDQSRNKEVFDIVAERIKQFIHQGKNIYYDATNVNSYYRKKFVADLKKKFPNKIEIKYVVLPVDSVDRCYERIKDDLENKKIDRSKVPYEVLEKQYRMYIDTLKSLDL